MTVSVVAVPEDVVNGDLVQRRVRLTLTSTVSGSGEPVTVWRVHEDGSEHRVIVPTGTRLSGGSTVVLDYHAPFNQSISYRAETATQTGPVSDPTAVVSKRPWILVADEPELSLPAAYVDDLGDEGAGYEGAATSRWVGTGRKTGISDRTVDLSSSLVVAFLPKHLAAWRRLLHRGDALLVNLHEPRWDRQWFWVMPTRVTIQNPGEKDNRFGGKAGHPFRLASFDYDPIDPPDTDLTPLWTDGDVAAAFATDALMEAAYASDLAHELDDRTA